MIRHEYWFLRKNTIKFVSHCLDDVKEIYGKSFNLDPMKLAEMLLYARLHEEQINVHLISEEELQGG